MALQSITYLVLVFLSLSSIVRHAKFFERKNCTVFCLFIKGTVQRDFSGILLDVLMSDMRQIASPRGVRCAAISAVDLGEERRGSCQDANNIVQLHQTVCRVKNSYEYPSIKFFFL